MVAIFKREFKAYFSTPLGYVFLTAFYFFLGFYFTTMYSNGSPYIEDIISAMSTVAVFAMPVLTMRLMSEERRQKIDQVLITAPVRLTSIVMGKFLAAFAVYAIGFAPTVIFEMIFASKVSVNILSYIYTLFGIFLLGAVLIALGMFISSLTESAVVSAILSLVINILVLYMSNFASMITVPESDTLFGKVWQFIVQSFVTLLEKLSFITAFETFSQSIFSVSDVVYFISLVVVFIFLSVRSLEKRRWS